MLDYFEPQGPDDPIALMVWLHGLGADGFDLEPAAEMLDVPGIRHVFPHAPVRAVTINGGMAMRAWYDIAAPDLCWQEDSAGMQDSVHRVRELVDGFAKDTDLPVLLGGFSQGAVISLVAAALGMPRLAGVVAMSGYVPQFLMPSLSSLRAIPVWMGHGEQDEVVPFALADASRHAMIDNGVELAWHAYAMPHTICQEEIRDIAAWLNRLPALGGNRP